jgi:hypothetical protein
MQIENLVIAGIIIIILAQLAVLYVNKFYSSNKVEEVLFEDNDTLQALKLKNNKVAKDFKYLGDINFSSTHLQHLLGETLDLTCAVTGEKIKYVVLFKSNLFLIYENGVSNENGSTMFQVWGKKMFNEFKNKLDEVFYDYYVKLSSIITSKEHLDENEYIMIATMMPQFKQYLVKTENTEGAKSMYLNKNFKALVI